MISNNLYINQPAWSGIHLDNLTFIHPLVPSINLYIQNMLVNFYFQEPCMVVESHSIKPVDIKWPVGHIITNVRFTFESYKLFVRIATPWQHKDIDILCSIFEYLITSEVSVQQWISRNDCENSPFVIDEKTFYAPIQFSVSWFKKMDIIPPILNTLQKAGSEIGKLHYALQKAPFSKYIIDATSVRIAELNKTKMLVNDVLIGGGTKVFKNRHGWIMENASLMKRFVAHYVPNLTIFPDCQPQIVHGDMNAGNILCDNDGKIVILDFEDTLHSFFLPLADLALFIERCILFDYPQEAVLINRLNAFFDGYLHNADFPFSSLVSTVGAQIAEMLCQINYYSIGIHLTLCRQGSDIFDDEEWNKFKILEQHAQYWRKVLPKLNILTYGFSKYSK